MKITFLLPTVGFSGGIRVVAIYADWLKNRGHDVTVISPPPQRIPLTRAVKKWLTGGGKQKYQRFVASHLDGRGLNHVVLDTHRPPKAGDIKISDVIVATWWETAEWLMALPNHLGAKAYFIQHHEVFGNLPRERCEATYRFPLHKIVVAKWLKELMNNCYHDTNVDLVSNGVDHNLFFAPTRSRQVRPTVGILYHEAPFKGVDVALSVVAKLGKKYPDLKVVAFGSKPPSGAFALPPFLELHVAPSQESLRGLYASCDVWLSTSRSEGFNLIALESMACRTPLVSTRTGWPIEGVRDGLNGYLVDVDDVDTAFLAVSNVLDQSEEAWMEMSANAHASVADLSWDESFRLFEASLFRASGNASHIEKIWEGSTLQ